MTSSRKILGLLIWKNWLLHRRNYVMTIFEILVPLFFIGIFILGRMTSDVKVEKKSTLYEAFDVYNSSNSTRNTPSIGTYIFSRSKILYTPKAAKDIMGLVCTDFFDHANVNYTCVGYDSEDDLVNSYKRFKKEPMNSETPGHFDAFRDEDDKEFFEGGSKTVNYENPVLAGIVFKNFKIWAKKKGTLEYKIRFKTAGTWDTKSLYKHPQGIFRREYGPRMVDDRTGGRPGYFSEGFLYLQNAIDNSILKSLTPENEEQSVDYDIKMKRFASPPYTDDTYIIFVAILLPLCLVLSFMFIVSNITKNIVIEKENRIKELLKMMGVANWLQWLAWFLNSFIIVFIIVALITLLLKAQINHAIIHNIDGSVLFVFLLAYGLSAITFAFLVSSYLSKANTAALASAGLWYLTFMSYFYVAQRYYTSGRAMKMGISIFSNMAMALGVIVITDFEGSGRGVTWSTISHPATPDDNISLLDMILMLLLDSLIYMLLACYFEAVFPGEYGIPRKWYFPCTKSFWCGGSKKKADDPEESTPGIDPKRRISNFEDDPKGLKVGIDIKSLGKKFKKKVAVNKISLKVYENQITALLGHNGAGKTTTISMLTGLIPPSSGTALIYDNDLRKDIDKIHQSKIGICPQYSVLFDKMTVQEHLKFFLKLKGFKGKEISGEVSRMLKVLDLEDKRKTKANKLSGGMKRKLSIGIALCGDSKVVFLDECTSGMDVGGRRFVWDLLKNEKKGRTIILSTHFMDEADVLGDRIAIMADGNIECCGTPLFLKKRYGGGYHLVIVKMPECQVENVTRVLEKYIPNIEISQNIGAELSYSLPDSKSDSFPKMFDELDEKKENLKISGYGVSNTTMEEVFINVGKEVDRRHSRSGSKGGISRKESRKESRKASNASKGSRGSRGSKGSGGKSQTNRGSIKPVKPKVKTIRNNYRQQFKAMMIKKFLFTKRNKTMLFFQFIIPIIILFIALISAVTFPIDTADDPPLSLSVARYGKPTTPMKCNSSDGGARVEKFCKNYESASNKHTKIEKVDKGSFDKHLSKQREKNSEFDNNHLVGMEAGINKDEKGKMTVIAYFNGQPFHTPPTSLNLVSNAILKERGTKTEIQVTQHPLPALPGESLIEINDGEKIIIRELTTALCFLSASFIFFLIKERAEKSKHLQFSSGVNYFIFWAANFVFDFLNYLIVITIFIVLLACFQIEGLKHGDVLVFFFLLMVFFGLAVIPLMYIFSFVFKSPSTGIALMTFFLFFSLHIPSLGISFFLKDDMGKAKSNETDTGETVKYNDRLVSNIEWFLIPFPAHFLNEGIEQISKNRKHHEKCPDKLKISDDYCSAINPADECCLHYKRGYFDWAPTGSGRRFFLLFFSAMLFSLIVLLIESKCCRTSCGKKKFPKDYKTKSGPKRKESLEAKTDSDVLKEAKLIQGTPHSELEKKYNLILKELTKEYYELVAVKGLNLGVAYKECFGLLGVNGAGKTTTFKMLTGDIKISYGDAFINSYSVKNEMKIIRDKGKTGYCPQFDALIEELTGRETIFLFARIRGIPENKINKIAEEMAKDLLFEEHLDKRVGKYSGGNKRKVSTAVAILGSPPLVFLDEPTTGMDPVARRSLWEVIKAEQEKGVSFILTSHSMEECEALCSRLAIMVNGQFRCLGSPQHLKNKFGKGYTLVAKVKVSKNYDKAEKGGHLAWEKDLEPLKKYIETEFPGSKLKEVHPGYIYYQIDDKSATLSKLFSKMENARKNNLAEAYSIGQTTLEQVFLHFTSAQKPSKKQ